MSDFKDKVVVLYSGGSDSTLAAALMCRRFKHVYLLTYKTSPMSNVERSNRNFELLKEKFPKNKIIREFINSDNVFKKIYYNNYFCDFKKFKTYLCTSVCAACSLSWHTKTIIYCLKNHIHTVCDGERYEDPPIWAEQMKQILNMVRNFYKEYGINYENPVYEIDRTDWKLYEMGITKEKDVKLEGFANSKGETTENPNILWKKSQPNCHGGIIGAIYLTCYFLPRFGQEENERKAVEYYEEKIKYCKSIISDQVDRKYDKRGVQY